MHHGSGDMLPVRARGEHACIALVGTTIYHKTKAAASSTVYNANVFYEVFHISPATFHSHNALNFFHNP